jgi:hypothetical protein
MPLFHEQQAIPTLYILRASALFGDSMLAVLYFGSSRGRDRLSLGEYLNYTSIINQQFH